MSTHTHTHTHTLVGAHQRTRRIFQHSQWRRREWGWVQAHLARAGPACSRPRCATTAARHTRSCRTCTDRPLPWRWRWRANPAAATRCSCRRGGAVCANKLQKYDVVNRTRQRSSRALLTHKTRRCMQDDVHTHDPRHGGRWWAQAAAALAQLAARHGRCFGCPITSLSQSAGAANAGQCAGARGPGDEGSDAHAWQFNDRGGRCGRWWTVGGSDSVTTGASASYGRRILEVDQPLPLAQPQQRIETRPRPRAPIR